MGKRSSGSRSYDTLRKSDTQHEGKNVAQDADAKQASTDNKRRKKTADGSGVDAAKLLKVLKAKSASKGKKPALSAAKINSKGTPKDEFDMQRLQGLQFVLKKKRAGDTLQEKKKAREMRELETMIATVQKEIGGGGEEEEEEDAELKLSEKQLAALGMQSTVDEKDYDAEDISENLSELLAGSADVDEGGEEEEDEEEEGEEDEETALYNQKLLSILKDQKSTPSTSQLNQYGAALQMLQQERTQKQVELQRRKELLAQLKNVKKKQTKENAGSKLSLELLENSASEALKMLTKKSQQEKDKALLSKLMKRKEGLPNVSPPPGKKTEQESAGREEEEEEDDEYKQHQRGLDALLSKFV